MDMDEKMAMRIERPTESRIVATTIVAYRACGEERTLDHPGRSSSSFRGLRERSTRPSEQKFRPKEAQTVQEPIGWIVSTKSGLADKKDRIRLGWYNR